jgi:hypothetical protein
MEIHNTCYVGPDVTNIGAPLLNSEFVELENVDV